MSLEVSLTKAFGNKGKAVDFIADSIFNKDFTEIFGEWNKENAQDIEESVAMRMRHGFPMVEKNDYGLYYFTLKTGEKLFVGKTEYGDIPVQHVDSIVRSAAKFFYDNYVSQKNFTFKGNIEEVISNFANNGISQLEEYLSQDKWNDSQRDRINFYIKNLILF